MPFVNIRQLADEASAVVHAVVDTGRPAIITNRGAPVAVLVPLDTGALEDWTLAWVPEFVASRAEADREAAAGQLTTMDAVLAGLDHKTRPAPCPRCGAKPGDDRRCASVWHFDSEHQPPGGYSAAEFGLGDRVFIQRSGGWREEGTVVCVGDLGPYHVEVRWDHGGRLAAYRRGELGRVGS